METVTLDPVEVSINRTEFDITHFIAQAGPDFGDAAIEQYLADVQQGQIPVDYRYPNRTVTVPLLLRDHPAHTFEELRAYFQQKTSIFQREGGWIKRETLKGPLYGQVMNAQLKLGGSTAQALWGVDADAVLTLTTLPDWFGDEIVDSIRSNPSNATELIYTITDVDGDLSARSRLILKNLSAIDMHGLLWGVRSRNYSADATARLVYEAEALTPVAPAAIAANANASGGSEVKIPSLSNNWTPVLSTDLAGVGSLTHIGTYRVWARVRTEVDAAYLALAGTTPRVRLVWDVGDLIQPVENVPIRLPLDADFFLADLGEIRIDRAPIGNHRWQGMIQAQEGYKPFAVDKIWFQPLDEAAGRLSMSPLATVGLTGYVARDPLNTDRTPVEVTGSPLPVGGAWTFSHGDTDDFLWDGANFRVKRSTISDTAPRFLYASGPTLTATAVQIDFGSEGASGVGASQQFLMFRRVDANNYGYAAVGFHEDSNVGARVYLGAVVGGAPVPLGVAFLPYFASGMLSLRVAVTPIGYIFAWVFPQNSALPPDPMVMRYDPTRFATGQVLASGKVGFGDVNTTATPSNRYFNNFLAWTPDDDAVIFAGKSAELRFDGMYREGPTGAHYSPMSTVLGDLLRLPPSGLEQRTTEIFLKPSFGDLDKASDSQLLRLEAQMKYRPSYLFVSED